MDLDTTEITQGGARAALLEAARAELVEHGRAAISLRAVARRAGVSHAAPKYHFRDRAGLLTAIATEGFIMLTAELQLVPRSERTSKDRSIAALGRAYIDFSLAHPALFDLMFRLDELHPDDPDLIQARREAIGVLDFAVADGDESGEASSSLSLMSWALAHGLAVLARDGALQAATAPPTPVVAVELAHRLVDSFAAITLGRVVSEG